MIDFNFHPVLLLAWPVLALFCVRVQRSWPVGIFEASAIMLLIAAVIPK